MSVADFKCPVCDRTDFEERKVAKNGKKKPRGKILECTCGCWIGMNGKGVPKRCYLMMVQTISQLAGTLGTGEYWVFTSVLQELCQ